MKLTLRSFMVTIAVLLALLVAMPLLVACGGTEEPAPAPAPAPTTEPAPAPAPAVSEFDVVKDAVAGYLAGPAGNINAADLKMKMADDPDLMIVSLRSAEDYAVGHIPGAVNMKFGDLTTIPMDEDVVLYCYTGQSASAGTAVLGILGYNVQNLRNGMSSWSNDPAVYKKRFDPATTPAGFDTETTPNTGGNYDLPVLDNTTSDDPAEILKAAALTVAPKFISAADLKMKIADGSEMTILSIRKPEIYAVGHIPGAINGSFSPALVDSLSHLNPDAPVYVYCYTGHTAGQTMALLQMLGYDAYSVSFGMCGWSTDPAVTGGVCFDPSTVAGYATEK